MKKTISNLQLPFRDRRLSRSSIFVNALPREEGAIRLLSSVIGILVFSYIGFVSMTIVNVIARKEAMDTSTALRAVVGQLERDYFALSNGVNAQSGPTLGLSPVSGANFVYRPGAVGAANADTNEL